MPVQPDLAFSASDAPAFEIKSAQLTLVALLVKSPDLAKVAAELLKKFGPNGESPDFFDTDGLVLDFSAAGLTLPHPQWNLLLNTLGQCRLVASAVRDGMRLISVVMGTASDDARMQESQKLLSYGFRHFESRELYAADVVLKQAEVFYGDEETIDLGLARPALVTFARGHYDDLKVELEVPKILEAPYALGAEVGTLRVTLEGEKVYEAPLVALTAVAESGFFSRFIDFVYLFFHELFGDE